MVFPGLAIDTLHVAVVPLMVIEADGVAACTDVACAVAEQDNNRIVTVKAGSGWTHMGQ